MTSFQNPYNKLADFEQPRDFSQKINATFDFLRVHFRPLSQCLVYYVLPVPLVGFIANGVAQKLFFQSFGNTFLEPTRIFGFTPAILLSYIPLIIGYTLLILAVYGYMILRLELPPSQPVEPPMVGAWMRSRFLPTLGGGVAMIVLLILACLLLLLPGIWLLVPTTLFFFVRLYEKRSIDSAITRCVDLVKNHWWATVGLLLVVTLIRFILPFILGVVFDMGSLFLNSLQWQDGNNLFYYVMQGISQMTSFLTNSISLVAVAFQYFNLVELKEGRGIYALLEQLGQPVGAAEPVNRFGGGYEDEEGEY